MINPLYHHYGIVSTSLVIHLFWQPE